MRFRWWHKGGVRPSGVRQSSKIGTGLVRGVIAHEISVNRRTARAALPRIGIICNRSVGTRFPNAFFILDDISSVVHHNVHIHLHAARVSRID